MIVCSEMISKLTKFARFIKREKRTPNIAEVIHGLNLKKLRMPLPTFIQVEPTTRCNFNCLMCTRKTLDPKRLNKDLRLEEFKEILRQIPTVKRIKVQGLGEPLLNTGIWNILDYGKNHGISFTTTTNGSLFKNTNIDSLLAYFDEVIISLDSTDEKNYSTIRGINSRRLNGVIKNIDTLIKRKKEVKSRTRIGLNSVISHLNYREVPKLIELSKSLESDFISIIEVENWKIPTEKDYVAETAFINEARKVKQEIRELVNRYKKDNNEIHYLSSERRKSKCRWPFDSFFVTVDGYVTPCCIRMDSKMINFGNIFEKPIKEIWNSEEYRMFRKSMIKNLPNPICDNCPD